MNLEHSQEFHSWSSPPFTILRLRRRADVVIQNSVDVFDREYELPLNGPSPSEPFRSIRRSTVTSMMDSYHTYVCINNGSGETNRHCSHLSFSDVIRPISPVRVYCSISSDRSRALHIVHRSLPPARSRPSIQLAWRSICPATQFGLQFPLVPQSASRPFDLVSCPMLSVTRFTAPV
jgi:hypothetical protein